MIKGSCVFHHNLLKYITLFAVFLIFVYFAPTNFAENLKVSLFSKRIFPNFEETLVNAWSLQHYGDLFVAGL